MGKEEVLRSCSNGTKKSGQILKSPDYLKCSHTSLSPLKESGFWGLKMGTEGKEVTHFSAHCTIFTLCKPNIFSSTGSACVMC